MATRNPGIWQRFTGWCHRNLPTRESMEESRLLRPVAHRVLAPQLWRFTRRSVPRGVALGMVTGILCPVAQIPFSAMLALPFRANIPSAALTTFITNPVTTPPLWVAAYYIGKWTLHLDRALPGDPMQDAAVNAAQSGWMQWLMSDAAPATALGLLIVTAVLSLAGYGLSMLGWRLWIARKWRSRHIRNHVDEAS